ncbi:MAG: hypothetical protein AAFN59_12060 [Pseudomonadota bacterium]
MELIADMLLIGAALGAGLYCVTLSRRLTRFNSLENGVGGAIAVLSAQVDGMTKTLETARSTAQTERETLDALTHRAEDVAKQLELLVASMHDLPLDGAKPGEGNAAVLTDAESTADKLMEKVEVEMARASRGGDTNGSLPPDPKAEEAPQPTMFSSRRRASSE